LIDDYSKPRFNSIFQSQLNQNINKELQE